MNKYYNQQANTITGIVSEKSIEELLNKESKNIYNELKSQKYEDFIYFFESIHSIVKNTFKYDYDLLDYLNIKVKKTSPPKNYSLEGVCRHGSIFAKALIESLAPELKIYNIHSAIDEIQNIYHFCLGIEYDNKFFIFNALSSSCNFGLISNSEELKKMGKIEKIINDEGEYLIEPIVSFYPKKEIAISYKPVFLKIFESLEKKVLWTNASEGKAKINIYNY
ncbi:MAG: hypothetical protein PHN56_01060 [Candidatus Nanoarchaeia archaeon]|nr:hypothetical protein [Candidatus Nanoarchaeia archaeon]